MIISKLDISNLFEIKNFYSQKDAEKILTKFRSNKKWEHILQKRSKHYSHVFKSNAKSMPDSKEPYLSSFWKNNELAIDDFIYEKTHASIKKIFLKHFKIEDFIIDLRCHKFKKGDYFRIHMDGYAGGYALTISLNKNWKWDWGGILNIIHGKNENKLLGLLPSWNSANLLNNYKHPSPHFVTPIRDFALETRYTITCFIKTK